MTTSAHGPRRRRGGALAAGLLCALLAVAGCSSDSGSERAGGAPEAADALPEEPGAGQDGDGDANGSDRHDGSDGEAAGEDTAGAEPQDADPAPRHLIRTAELTVRTDDVPDGYATAVALVEDAGGYVSAEETHQDRDGHRSSRVTLRVPTQEYGGLLSDLAALGELDRREVTTEDVTDEVVDVNSRVASQEESVTRVRELMDEADSLEDVVALESELARRQSDLESLKARQAELRDQTELATIRLQLREPEAQDDAEEDDGGTGPSVPDVVSGGWAAFVATVLWTVAVAGAALPFVLAVLLLALGARVLARRRRGARTPAPVTTPEPLGAPSAPQEPPATGPDSEAER